MQPDLFTRTEQLPKYHLDNLHIYEAFEKFTLRAIHEKKFKHWSCDAIFNIMRWETGISGDDEFKLNNDYRAFYSRLFMKNNPEHQGFFRIRKSKFDNQK